MISHEEPTYEKQSEMSDHRAKAEQNRNRELNQAGIIVVLEVQSAHGHKER